MVSAAKYLKSSAQKYLSFSIVGMLSVPEDVLVMY